jgi:hypothetical protein
MEQCGRLQVMTAMSVPLSPPHSGVFIAVVASCRWTPLSPLFEVLPLLASKVAKVKYS